VNNAGGLGGRMRFEEMTTDFYRKVMALNLDSTFFVSRAAIPFLKNGEHATIINYTSNAGWNAGGPGAGIYGTSKAGVHAITRALAKDLAEYGIRVNAVSPGTIDTPFHAQIKATKPEVFASWKNNIMLGRLGQPEEVASVVSFLSSSDASFMTAETVQIGGGQALGI
jgi:NAD(P)-dependent dehydrogenase (short-subunit alcohol dehydrogenase family)